MSENHNFFKPSAIIWKASNLKSTQKVEILMNRQNLYPGLTGTKTMTIGSHWTICDKSLDLNDNAQQDPKIRELFVRILNFRNMTTSFLSILGNFSFVLKVYKEDGRNYTVHSFLTWYTFIIKETALSFKVNKFRWVWFTSETQSENE